MASSLRLRFTSRNNVAYLKGAEPNWQFGTRFSPRVRLSLLEDKLQFHLRGEGSVTNADRTFIGAKYWDSQPSSSLSDRSFLSFYEYEPKSKQDHLRANLGLRRLTATMRPISDFQIQLGINRWDIKDLEGICMEGVYSWACKFAFASLPIGIFGGEIAYDRKRIKTVGGLEKANVVDDLEDEECQAKNLQSSSAENKKRCSRVYASLRITPGGKFGQDSQLFILPQVGGQLNTSAGINLATTAYLGAYENIAGDTPLFDAGWTLLAGIGILAKYKGFRLLGAYSYRNQSQKDELALPLEEQRRAITLSPSYEWNLKKGELRLQGTVSFLQRSNTSSFLFEEEQQVQQEREVRAENIIETNLSYRTPTFWGKSSLTLSVGYFGSLISQGDNPNSHGMLFGLQTDFRKTIPLKRK